MTLTLELARKLADLCLERAGELGLKPLTVAVLDAAGQPKALLRQDGTSLMRPEIAQGKARGAIGMGLGSRALFARAQEQPYFIQAMNAIAGGALVPVPGGVLIRSEGEIIGAIGVTGDTSDNDEACAIHAIEAVGLVADPG
ncbi:MAG: GlcG protein [Rhodovulum sulfidophilum]|uniref:GlcG protein n=1 Tax=Rhodovulum sulfidophilum TaxID=35806 RepID=A0A2W5PNC2_RHOSU|nr:MAG: GlcG protein [Rhodovulum sulfidophilum]